MTNVADRWKETSAQTMNVGQKKWAGLLIALFVGNLVLRLSWIARVPVFYGVDATERMVNRDRIVVSVWLPALQFLLFSLNKITSSVIAARIMMAVISCFAIVLFAVVLSRVFNKWVGIIAAVLLSANPLFNYLSTTFYIEPLFSVFLFLSICFFIKCLDDKFLLNFTLCSLCFTCLSLTRYESWFLIGIMVVVFPFLLFYKTKKKSDIAKGFVLSLFFFSIGMIGWTLYNYFAHGALMSPVGVKRVEFGYATYIHSLKEMWNVLPKAIPLLMVSAAPAGIAISLFEKSKRIVLFHSVYGIWIFVYVIFMVWYKPYSQGNVRMNFLLTLYIVAGNACLLYYSCLYLRKIAKKKKTVLVIVIPLSCCIFWYCVLGQIRVSYAQISGASHTPYTYLPAYLTNLTRQELTGGKRILKMLEFKRNFYSVYRIYTGEPNESFDEYFIDMNEIYEDLAADVDNCVRSHKIAYFIYDYHLAKKDPDTWKKVSNVVALLKENKMITKKRKLIYPCDVFEIEYND